MLLRPCINTGNHCYGTKLHLLCPSVKEVNVLTWMPVGKMFACTIDIGVCIRVCMAAAP